MVFSSMVFLCVFLPVVFGLHLLLPGMRAKNCLLVIASLLFYAYGEPVYVILLIGSSIGNYIFARLVGEHPKFKRISMVLAVIVNLGLLVLFKYSGFLVETFNSVTNAGIPVPEIRMPIGISFFTFQAMSYVIDVYRGTVEVQKNPFYLGLYVSFFPQLVAGPIVRYSSIADQIKNRKESWSKISVGSCRFVVGLSKKILISNNMAIVTDRIFAMQAEGGIPAMLAWLGAIAYTMQIYYDFSGYSDMAIGLGLIFGFKFEENFNYPYISTSIREFWRRWHISLSTWFREYLYIPLGGNRKGQVRTYVNLLIVFFATGLWHGAGATFIIWGLYHGLFLVVERMGLGKLLEKNCFRGLNHIYTTLVVVVGWVFFRADTLADAKVILHQMFTWENGIYPASLFVNRKVIFLAVLGVLLSGIVQSICPKLREHLYEKEVTKTVDIVIMAVLLFLCTMYLVSSTYNPFIYFRF